MIQDYISKKFISEINAIKADKFSENKVGTYKYESYSLVNTNIFPKEDFISYFSKYKMDELIGIKEALKKFNLNQLAAFSYALEGKVILNNVNKFVPLNNDLHRIKNHLPLTEGPFRKGLPACKVTIKGFIRAFESGNVVFSKAIINGKLKRVFIKTSYGSSNPNLDVSRSFLILDPQTLKVYNLAHSISLYNKPVFLNLKSLKRIGDLKNFEYEPQLYEKYLKTISGVADVFLLKNSITKFLNKAYKKDGVLGVTRIKGISKAWKKAPSKKDPPKVVKPKKSIFPKSTLPKRRK